MNREKNAAAFNLTLKNVKKDMKNRLGKAGLGDVQTQNIINEVRKNPNIKVTFDSFGKPMLIKPTPIEKLGKLVNSSMATKVLKLNPADKKKGESRSVMRSKRGS